MNKTNHDKIWELSASKVHHEANPTENSELEELLKHPENRKIYEDVNNLNRKLPETAPLTHSSASRSWQRITRYFESKKVKLYLNITKYAAIIILAFVIGTLFQVNWKPVPEIPPVYTEVFVPLGQMSEMTLSTVPMFGSTREPPCAMPAILEKMPGKWN
jgi:transmembrane sensor